MKVCYLCQQVFFLLLMEGSLVNKADLQALNLSGTYCDKTGLGPPSCAKPRQLSIYVYRTSIDVNKFFQETHQMFDFIFFVRQERSLIN